MNVGDLPSLQTVPAAAGGDDIQAAMARVRGRLRRAGDPHPVHVEFMEDELREGRAAVEEVRGYLDDVVALLARPDARVCDLVDLADDPAILERLDDLTGAVSSLRRRLMQLAASRTR